MLSLNTNKQTKLIEAKFHVEPPWDGGTKVVQMVQVIVQDGHHAHV